MSWTDWSDWELHRQWQQGGQPWQWQEAREAQTAQQNPVRSSDRASRVAARALRAMAAIGRARWSDDLGDADGQEGCVRLKLPWPGPVATTLPTAPGEPGNYFAMRSAAKDAGVSLIVKEGSESSEQRAESGWEVGSEGEVLRLAEEDRRTAK